ncbi:A disintegrin and metalloproteinase with thrombospondin motifs 9 [Araneus ventricosus]|uniref:A disintegrin and metalloproteinase with thrombospondin motifs 9 n=1 Tax=Araneus ventricosus TaxID=182803 RepID=A0A4Y2T8E0_ARAVE|nr:A disintegrin and metalloproteinase with thrombospondin motifs 9 [Araneus ventricosus]
MPCPKPSGCEAMWHASEWSECDRTCGNGNRTRTVQCSWKRKTLHPLFCDADKKPVEYESCTLEPCEEVKWTVSEWSGCEDSCSPNTQSRQVQCTNEEGAVFPNNSCDASQMPEVTKPCPKPARCDAVWHASEWSECEDSCSPSIQSRQIHCVNDEGVVFPGNFCNASKMPEVTKSCPKPSRCEAMWHVSEWSECDRKCGNGSRTRIVVCSSGRETLFPLFCDADKKPVETQTCTRGQCEDVKWQVSDWSGCEDSCSPRMQSRQVHCANQAEVVFPDDACDAAKMPEVTKPCPKSEQCKAMWHVSEWSKVSSPVSAFS